VGPTCHRESEERREVAPRWAGIGPGKEEKEKEKGQGEKGELGWAESKGVGEKREVFEVKDSSTII